MSCFVKNSEQTTNEIAQIKIIANSFISGIENELDGNKAPKKNIHLSSLHTLFLPLATILLYF